MTAPARRSLDAAVRAMDGVLLSGPTGGEYVGAATDSRAVTPGRLFFALKGERVDGFDYCATVVGAGAAAVVVPRARGVPAGCAAPVIGVDDPRAALIALARAVRAEFRGRVVGITGSNGKTTTKELVAAALDLRATDLGGSGDVLRTAGNFNTEIGMPLTILEASGREAFWVLEMAMRGRGEIALLADIAQPHVGLVTNVAAAHLGRLGSLAEVAKAKGEIYGGLGTSGIGILPAGDPLLEAEAAVLPEARKRRFEATVARAEASRADVRVLDYLPAGIAGSVVRLAVGETPVVVRLPLAGAHNAANAAAALAVVHALGLPPAPAATAIARVELPAHRSRLIPLGGRLIMDDCYNANPASMAAALRTIADAAANRGQAFAVVGDMLELGPETADLHRAVGTLAAELGLGGLVAIGEMGPAVAEGARAAGMKGERVVLTDDPAAAAAQVLAWTRPGDAVLVKASRGLRLERVVDALTASFAPRSAA